MLTREQILQSDDLPRETVPVPEWGGSVRIRTLSGADRDGYNFFMEQGMGKTLTLLNNFMLRRQTRDAEAQARNAQAALQRDEAMFSEGLIAEARVRVTRNHAQAAQAHWQSLLASLRASGLGAEEGDFAQGRVRAPRAGEVVEARGCVVTPGLVNTHHHLYQTLTRAVPGGQDALLFGWLKTLYPIWSRFGPEEMFVSAQVGLAELALSGCTLTSDHLYLYPNGARLDDTIAAAAEAAPRRAVSSASSRRASVTATDGPSAPAARCQARCAA